VNTINEPRPFRGIDFDPRKGVFADAERIRIAADGAHSLADILEHLGLRSSGARYAQLRAAMAKHGIRQPTKDRLKMAKSVLANRETVAQAVRRSKTQKQTLELLGLSLAGKNYDRLTAACAVYRIPLPAKWGVSGPCEQEWRERWDVLRDEDAIRAAVCNAPNWSVAAQRLWGPNDLRDREALKARCAELSLIPGGRRTRGILTDRDAVAAAVSDAQSVIDALTRLNLSSSSHQRLVQACEEYGLRVPRADRAAMGRIGQAKAKASYRWGRPEDVLRRDPSIAQRRVRNMVLRYDLLPYLCAICGSPPAWKGHPLVLILDHANGDPSDHRLENLRFVCPNCESQLPTHGSRNGKRRAALNIRTCFRVTDLLASLRRRLTWFDSRRKRS
jgi:hypothetical protein